VLSSNFNAAGACERVSPSTAFGFILFKALVQIRYSARLVADNDGMTS